MCQGLHLLGQGKLDDAVDFIKRSQLQFAKVNDAHSEAVALLAQGIVLRRKYEEVGSVYPKPLWADALKALQSSLTIFRDLGDGRQAEVRDQLAEIHRLFQKDLEARTVPKPIPTRRGPAAQSAEQIPVYDVAAGQPISVEESQEFLSLDGITDDVSFALRVRGDSMADAGIFDGDLILMERRRDATRVREQIVAMAISPTEEGTQLTLKRFRRRDDHILLEPANQESAYIVVTARPRSASTLEKYEKIYSGKQIELYAEQEVQIEGWAKALIREKVQ
jgi:repressor LexA